MRSSRRVRREFFQIESELSRDEALADSFASVRWPDSRTGPPRSSVLGDFVLRPATFWRAWLATIVLQSGNAASCAIAAATQQTMLIVMVLLTLPLTLTPLIAWSHAHPTADNYRFAKRP